MEQAIKWVKIGSSKNHKTVNGYLQGYFEFLIYSNNELKFLDYNPYFMGSEIPVMNSIAQGIVHGQPAHVGIVTGIARIVRNASELHKIQKGDILVTGMTTPEFIPVFDKIKGIITDTGGILCHAAIISREIGIPCIVGTENATRVLKNGQKIEVDATQGIVQILENKKA